MAVIAQNSSALSTNGPVTLSKTTLSSSDTLNYVQGAHQLLILYNGTAGALTPNLVGSSPIPIDVPGYGGQVSTSGGKTLPSMGAGVGVIIDLDDISAYLAGSGVVTVTGALNMLAFLFN